MRVSTPRWIAVVPGLIVCAMLAASAPGFQGSLAIIGEERITVGSFLLEMERRTGGLPDLYATHEQRRVLLDEMIELEALAEAARAEGYDRHPDVVAAVKRLLVARYKKDRLEARLTEIDVADHEIESFYEQHKHEYARPERYRAAVIRVGLPADPSANQRAEAESKLEQALEEARNLEASTTHFGAVSVKYSDDRASRYRGGVIGWLTRDAPHEYRWAPEVVNAVFDLERSGDIAPIVHTDDALYLVRLVDREASEVRSLAALRDGFRNQILRAKQERIYREFIEETLSSLDVRVDESLLDSIPLPETAAPQKQPPAMPAG